MCRRRYCGECPMFRYEDTDGIGECFVCKELRTCGQKCKITRDNITEKQVLRILHYEQKWRRGTKLEMLSPVLFGVAIDGAMRFIRKTCKNKP